MMRPRWLLASAAVLLGVAPSSCALVLRQGSRVQHNASAVRASSEPSLFCFMVVRPTLQDVELLTMHLEQKLLSGCNAFDVYSNETLEVLLAGTGWAGKVVGGPAVAGPIDRKLMPNIAHPEGLPYPANTPVFRQVWREVLRVGHFRAHDWTVKVDPDTVFLPSRLRSLLRERYGRAAAGIATYLTPESGFQGAIEVFNREAVEAWGAVMDKCSPGSSLEDTSEDYDISQCLQYVAGVAPSREPALLVNYGECGWHVAAHAYKDRQGFLDCLMGFRSTSAKLQEKGLYW